MQQASSLVHWLPAWSPLIAQALFAILTIELLRRFALPSLDSPHHGRLFSDALGPLILVAPMLFAVGRVPADVRSAGGWLPVAGPVVCGLFGLAAAMMSSDSRRAARANDQATQARLEPRAIAAWTGAGLLLLLLGAAHDLSLWVGQFALAAGAVLLWMNTPDLAEVAATARNDARSAPTGDARASAAITAALVCAMAHGLTAMLVPREYVHISSALTIATAAMILAATARLAGPIRAMRLGGWAATYGVLMTPGFIALLQMLPRALEIVRTGSAPRLERVAYGFGGYAIEGLALLLLASGFLAQRWIASDAARRWIGMMLVMLTAALAAVRISGG